MLSDSFDHRLVELSDLARARLADADDLSAALVAAASAMGLSTEGPPIVRRSARGVAVGAICRDGHIVLHAIPEQGRCLVDVVVRSPAAVGRALEIIARRLRPTAGSGVT